MANKQARILVSPDMVAAIQMVGKDKDALLLVGRLMKPTGIELPVAEGYRLVRAILAEKYTVDADGFAVVNLATAE
jgi:hypothetical protein